MRELPPLATLEAFEAVMRTKSTVAASHVLHLTHSAISKKITRLERELGCRLFDRTAEGMTPTPAAVKFAQAVEHSLDALEAGTRQARGATDDAGIVLSCEPTLLIRWLIPRLNELTETTGIEVSVRSGGGPIDMRRSGIDAALRRSDFQPSPNDQVQPLVQEFTGPVCAPGLLGDHTPNDDWLAHNVAISSTTRPTAWNHWSEQTGHNRPGDRRAFDHHYEALAASEAGLGIALAPYVLATDALEAGSLVAPFGFTADGTTYDLHTPVSTPHRDLLITLADWLQAQLPEPIR